MAKLREEAAKTLIGLSYRIGDERTTVRVDKDLSKTSELFIRVKRGKFYLNLYLTRDELEHLIHVADSQLS